MFFSNLRSERLTSLRSISFSRNIHYLVITFFVFYKNTVFFLKWWKKTVNSHSVYNIYILRYMNTFFVCKYSVVMNGKHILFDKIIYWDFKVDKLQVSAMIYMIEMKVYWSFLILNSHRYQKLCNAISPYKCIIFEYKYLTFDVNCL